jgi:hypothetical protein
MVHKIVSFYREDLNPEVIKSQKKVFDFLGIELEQVGFSDLHSDAINRYLSENNEYDLITLFDVDCIPLSKKVIDKVKLTVNDDVIYGNAQITHPFTLPFAAPSFLSFTKNLYETSPEKSFTQRDYPEVGGIRADVGEVFVKENILRGKKMILSYPIHCQVKRWSYVGDSIHKPFKYGNGTIFDNQTYHRFEIRDKIQVKFFIDFVNNFLNNR